MLNPDFRDMLSAFADAGVEYLVVGAYALAAHGVPRATGDLDCWIRRTEENAVCTMRALETFGAPTLDVTIEAEQRSREGEERIGGNPSRF